MRHALEADFLAFTAAHPGSSIVVVGHSFGAFGALSLTQKFPQLIAGTVFIDPALSFHSTQKKIAGLAAADFEGALQKPEMASKIRDYVSRSQSSYDAPMREALDLALQDPALLTHYFAQLSTLQEYASHLAAPEAQMDLDSFRGVTASVDLSIALPRSGALLKTPVLAFYGENDPVIAMDEELTILRGLFANVQEQSVAGASHFSHLDEPETFADALSKMWTEQTACGLN